MMIFKNISHPCVIIDVPADVWVEEIIETSAGVFIINVWAAVFMSVP